MPLQPGASVKSKYDTTRSRFEHRWEYPLVAGTNLTEEGQWLIAGGTTAQEVTTSAGNANEVPMGVALYPRILATTFTHYETWTVPAAPGPYTVTLEYNNLVTNGYTTFADAYLYDNTGATQLEVAGAAVAGTSVTLAVATGIVTFAAGDAGHAGFIRYRWTLTTVQSLEILKQSAVGRGSTTTYGKVIVGHGNCVIHTTMFDADAEWVLNQQTYAGVNGNPCLGAGGVLTIHENNNNGTKIGRVISLPSATDPYLGLEYATQRA